MLTDKQIMDKIKKAIAKSKEFSYESEELINECLNDIDLFGDDFMVFAKYQTFYEDNKDKCEFIVDYVDADLPNKDEAEFEENYKELLKAYEQGIDSVKGCHVEKITLKELLDRLTYQNVNFK